MYTKHKTTVITVSANANSQFLNATLLIALGIPLSSLVPQPTLGRNCGGLRAFVICSNA